MDGDGDPGSVGEFMVSKSASKGPRSFTNTMMSGLITIMFMSTLLGLGSFSVGILPLFCNFSSTLSFSLDGAILKEHVESHLAKLSTLGTGLLLGAALGVIIPEYVHHNPFAKLSNNTVHQRHRSPIKHHSPPSNIQDRIVPPNRIHIYASDRTIHIS